MHFVALLIGSSAKEVLLSSHLSIYHDHCLRWNSDKNPNDMKKTTYPKVGKRNRWNLHQSPNTLFEIYSKMSHLNFWHFGIFHQVWFFWNWLVWWHCLIISFRFSKPSQNWQFLAFFMNFCRLKTWKRTSQYLLSHLNVS